jgi:hypothetical protein
MTGQIDAANAELANAQQAAKMKEQDLQQLERRRDNLHQQVSLVACAHGRRLLQVDTSAAIWYSPHQITQHKSKVQAPALKGTSRMVGGLSHTAPQKISFSS